MIKLKGKSLGIITALTLLTPLLMPAVPASAQSESGKSNTNTAQPTPELFGSADKLLSEGKFKEAYTELVSVLSKLKKENKVKEQVLAFERIYVAQRRLGNLLDAGRSLKFATALCKPEENDFEGFSSKSRIYFNLAELEDLLGQYKEADYKAQEGLKAVRSLEIAGKLPYLETELLNISARINAMQGNLTKAGELINEASYMVKSLPEKPEEFTIPGSFLSASKAFITAKVASSNSLILEVCGKEEEAKKKALEASEIFNSLPEETLSDSRYAKFLFIQKPDEKLIARVKEKDNLVKAAMLEALAQQKIDNQEFKAAAPLLEECLSIRYKFMEKSSATIGNTEVDLAVLQLKLGNYKKSALMANSGYQTLSRVLPATSPMIARATATLAKAYMASGETNGVEPLLTHAWKLEAKRLGNDSPEVLDLMETLSELYVKTGQYVKAIKMGAPVTAKLEKEFGAGSTQVVPSLTSTGAAYARLRKPDKATVLLARAKSILEKNGKTKTKEYGEVLASLGVNDTLKYNWDKAKVKLTKAIDLYRDLYGENHASTIAMKNLYREMYKKRRKVPGINKNLLKQGSFKAVPAQMYNK